MISFVENKKRSIVVISIASLIASATAPALAGNPVRSLQEMREENIVRQEWDLSCAAAALATILRYQHGQPVTERSVALGLINRTEYLANPDLVRLRQGFSLLDLKRYVDGMGFNGVGFGKMTLADLETNAPTIVPVNLQGFPHFVVFRGTTGREVLLADPAFGNITMSAERFEEAWIDYRDIGQVGFIVKSSGTQAPPGALKASDLDFPILR